MTVMVIKPHQEKELHHSWAFPRLTTLILTLPRIKSYKSIEDLRPALQASKNTLQKFEVMGEGISIFGLKKLLSTFFRDSYPSLQVLSLPACPRSSKGSHTGNMPVSVIFDALDFIPMVLPVQEVVLTIGLASATPLASILQSLAANTQQDGKLPDLRLIKYVWEQSPLGFSARRNSKRDCWFAADRRREVQPYRDRLSRMVINSRAAQFLGNQPDGTAPHRPRLPFNPVAEEKANSLHLVSRGTEAVQLQ